MRLRFLLTLSLTLAACAEPVHYATVNATGGDRTQGVMQMAATYTPGKEQLNWSQAESTASMRCQAWGFVRALPFDDMTEACSTVNFDGSCAQMTATRTYQCSVR